MNELDIWEPLMAALCAGGLVGFERNYHGRPAGFRTHTLVCLASSLLMIVSVYQSLWFTASDSVRLDPTRMAQGIMTGIGFLGAGVIVREGANVRGLTTAASIWTTAGLGVLAGVGMYEALVVATLLVLIVLSAFRVLERWLPAEQYSHLTVQLGLENRESPEHIAERITALGYSPRQASIETDVVAGNRRITMTLKTTRPRRSDELDQLMLAMPGIQSYSLHAAGE
jgi:putative Mg2+ transporter-C (MgtC) family protein